MDDQQVAALRERLETKLERVQAEVADFRGPDVMLRHKREVEIPAVEEAIRRLDEGVYGICIDCDDEIGYDRLMQRPETLFCAPCLSEREEAGETTTRMT